VRIIQLNEKQTKILDIVKKQSPITGEKIAQLMNTTRASLRSDLTFLTQLGMLEARPRVGYCYSDSRQGYDMYMRMVQMSVGDYQSESIVINENASAYDALVSLFTNNIGTLFIVGQDGLLEGVLSRKDLLKLAIGSTDMHKVPVSVVMTRMPNLIMTTPDESLWIAAQKLIEHEIDGLPVVEKVGTDAYKVLGRFTKTNVVRAFVDIGSDYSENQEMDLNEY
jgi:CBS domain-containing protein